jgi:hypothetical protein
MVLWFNGLKGLRRKPIKVIHFNYTVSKEIAKLIYNEIPNGYSLLKP